MKRSSGVTALIVAGFGAVGAAITAMVVSKKKKEAGAASGAAKPPTPTSAVLTQYPVPPVPQMPGAPGAQPGVPQVVFPAVPSADMQQKVADALASNDPAKMRAVAAELRAAGNTTGAQSLEAIATGVATTNAAINAGVAAVQQILTPPGAQPPPVPAQPPPAVPLPSQPVPSPVVYPQPQPTAEQPQQVLTIPTIPGVTAEPITLPMPVQLPAPSPTAPPASMWPETDPTRIDTAQRMATMLATKKPYTEDTTLVKAFQAQEGLSPVDGLYGPGTATRLAQDYGIIPPKPYYWSKNTAQVPAQKAAYQQAMNALAVKDPARASLWQAAGNVYTATPAPVSIPVPTAAPTMQVPGFPVSFPTAPQGVLTALVQWPETDPTRIDVANRMNTMLAAKKPYTEDTALVKAFQAQEGLSPVDGLYGPGTATRLAQDYGIIPTKPYYWSKTASKVPQQKADYRAAMNVLAIKDPLRAAQWLAAANV